MATNPSTTCTEPSYFHRQYENDLPTTQTPSGLYNQCKRIGLVALPFISLYKPLGKSLSLFSDGSRTITSLLDFIYNLKQQNISGCSRSTVDLILAVSSLTGTIFLHPIGMCITSTHDILLNLYKICEALNKGNKNEAAKQLIQLVNNSLYLSLMIYGSLEMQIASIALQIILESFNSINELKNKNFLEFASHIIMTGIRINQLIPQVQLLKKEWEIQAAIKKIFVGELHEEWQFPSDHLPIGVKIDDIEIVSWNVLNNDYIEWVYKDNQGLNHSLITDLDKKINDEGLTARDKYVIDMIISMLAKSSNRTFLCLQECSSAFLKELDKSIPANWKLIKSEKELIDQNVVLYNSDLVTYLPDQSEISFDGYPCNPGRSILNLLFKKKNDQKIRIFNTHAPGDPNLPGLDEFANYIKTHSDQNDINVALGDLNFEREKLIESLKQANLAKYDIHSPYNTNIDPFTKESKCIDHIIIFGKKVSSNSLKPNEIVNDLKKTVDLLSTQRKKKQKKARKPFFSL